MDAWAFRVGRLEFGMDARKQAFVFMRFVIMMKQKRNKKAAA
jgi:hypothetical protein